MYMWMCCVQAALVCVYAPVAKAFSADLLTACCTVQSGGKLKRSTTADVEGSSQKQVVSSKTTAIALTDHASELACSRWGKNVAELSKP